MAASREKVLYFEPQPSEQTAALKTVCSFAWACGLRTSKQSLPVRRSAFC